MSGRTGTLIAGRYLLAEPAGPDTGADQRWRAHDQLLDREVALAEVALPPQASDEQAAQAFARARAAARLDHPGIVTVYDVANHDGRPWLVSRYLPAPTLGEEIARRGRLPWREVARIGAQTAVALAAAHAAGAAHGALTTDSIQLDGADAGQVLVTGFGAADSEEASPAADEQALGTVLHTAVEGSPPPAAGPLVPSQNAGPLAGLIESLLAPAPDQRPGAASAAATLAELAASPEPSAAPAPPPARSASAPHRPAAERPAAERPAAERPAAKRPARAGSLSGFAGPVSPRSALAVGGIIGAAMVVVLILLVFVAGNHAKPKSAGAVASANLSGTLVGPAGAQAQDVAFTPDGSTIAASFAGSGTSPVRIDFWSAAGGGTVIRTLSDPASGGAADSLAFNPRDSNALAVAGRTGIDLWQLVPRAVRTFKAPGGQQAVSVGYAPDGSTVAESSSAGGVFQLDPASGKWVTRLAGEAGDSGGPVVFSPDGKTIAVADASGRVRVQPAAGGAATEFTGAVTGSKIQPVAFSPDGKTLALATASGGVQLRDVTSGKVTARFSGSGAQAVAFSPDGTALAVGEAGGAVDFWDLSTRSEISVSLPAGAGGAVSSLAFSPDGKTLAVASSGGARIYLYNMKYIAS